MADSLFDLSSRVRKIILGILVFLAIFLSIDTAIKFLNSPANPFLPITSLYLEANDALGPIPAPKIPSLAIDDSSLPTFSIEGVFPAMPDNVFVYKIETPREKLNTVEDAVAAAAVLGFTSDYSELGGGILKWENTAGTRSLEFDRNLQTWKMRTQYFIDVEAAKPKQIQDNLDNYASKASAVASALGFTDQSLTRGFAQANFAKLGVNGLFTSPLTAASSDYVVGTIYREIDMAKPKPVSQLPEALRNVTLPNEAIGRIYKTDPRIGSFRTVMTGQVNNMANDVYEVDFVNYEYNYNYGIYRVLSPSEAWDQVRLGNGSLALIQPPNSDYFAQSPVLNVSRFVASASQVELGYWEPPIDDPNRYVYPIYIFRGRAELADNRPAASFVFYVDALKRF